MIRVKDYNHIGIVVKKLKESVWFYSEVLGLRSIERPDFGFPGHWYQVGDHTQLHLMVFDEELPESMRHIALEVEDFDETLKQLEAKGIEIVDGPGKRVDGSDWLFCRDPDGNLVEITKR